MLHVQSIQQVYFYNHPTYVQEYVELRRLEPDERTVFPLFKDKHATEREFYVDEYGREYEVDSYDGWYRH